MDIVSNAEMKEREQRVFAQGTTAEQLMERAGVAMAERIWPWIETAATSGRKYPQLALVLVGKGNNGGDALVVARELVRGGASIFVSLACPELELSDLALKNLLRLRNECPGVLIEAFSREKMASLRPTLLIDGLLGLNAYGPLRVPYLEIIAAVNELRASRFLRTVALDVPSGLAAYEEGAAPATRDGAIIADLTLSVGFAKQVLCREALSDWVGRIEVVPWSYAAATAPAQTLDAWELAPLLPLRSAQTNKGHYGRVVIIAGSAGFTGAPILAAQGAQMAGAGLLSVVTTPDAYAVVASRMPPEIMVSAWADGAELPEVVADADVLVIGPGLGVSEATRDKLWRILHLERPVVIDADGLNVLADNLDFLNQIKASILLTPHPGEMSRLLGRKFEPKERESVAREFTSRYPVTLLLKGTRTLITAAGQPLYYNTTGNPALSTGGSGDTLSGMLGALLGQGITLLNAARFGAWWHGHAADLAVETSPEVGMTPTQLAHTLPAALASMRRQVNPICLT